MTLADAWYSQRWRLCWLWPLHLLMRVIVAVRRTLYRRRVLPSEHPQLPVIVVGNITVGGAGKTPLVLWLVDHLRQQGWRPGIVSRGYGGKAASYPCSVTEVSAANDVGDEPLLLHRTSKVPVVVDPQRVRAAKALREQGCDIIVSDDGLQHYALQRDMEIVVIDAVRQLGNGWLMPAGPLRELPARLQRADFRVGNGAAIPTLAEHVMRLQPDECLSLTSEGEHKALIDFAGQQVHAVAGIGNPARFFTMLRAAGIQVIEHPFIDHHRYTAEDMPWQELPILMTEKDAVKCATFARSNMWSVRVCAVLDNEFVAKLDARLLSLRDGLAIHDGEKHGQTSA